MVVNLSSIDCHKRETTSGTAEITAVDTPTSEFGGRGNDDNTLNVDVPAVDNELLKYWNQSSRHVNLVYGSRLFPPFQKLFKPCSPLAYYEFLGYGALVGSVGTLSMRDTGKKDSYTIRHEEREGTNQLIQSVGSFNTGIYGKAELNKDEICMQTWNWQSLEDNGDRDSLTTLPTFPESITSVYTGKPEVTWDVGGGGEIALSECYKAEWSQEQNFSIVKTGSTYTINLHEYKEVPLKLVGVMASNTQWNALIDRTTHNIKIKTYKQNDLTKYKTMNFYNCKVTKPLKSGVLPNGGYVTALNLQAEYFTVDFINEFSTHFTDWFVNAPP